LLYLSLETVVDTAINTAAFNAKTGLTLLLELHLKVLLGLLV